MLSFKFKKKLKNTRQVKVLVKLSLYSNTMWWTHMEEWG